MKCFLLPFLSFFLFIFTIAGQHSRTLKLVKEDPLTFSSSEYDLQILDVRMDTSSVGFISRENYARPVLLVTELPLAIALQKVLKQRRDRERKNKLYLRIIKLQLAEYETKGVDSRSEIVVDFITRDQNGLKILHQSGAVLSRNGSRSLGKHRKDLISLLQKMIDGFEEVVSSENKFENIRIGNLWDLGPLPFPVLHADVLEIGLYENFFQFRNNVPGIKQGYILDWGRNTAKGRILVKVRSEQENEIIKNIWGFCDGQNMYIKLGTDYHMLNFSGEKDSVTFIVDTKHINDRIVLHGSIFFGISGGLVGWGIAELMAIRGEARFYLNLSNGEILSKEIDQGKPSQGPMAITILRNSKSDNPLPIDVYIIDHKIGSLDEAKCMVQLDSIPDRKGQVVVRGTDVYLSAEIEDHADANLFFILEEKSNRLQLRKLTDEQASYHLTIIEKYQDRKAAKSKFD